MLREVILMYRLTGIVGKRSHTGLTLLIVIDSYTKGFVEILSDILLPQVISLSFKYERPEESCRSFTLTYFSKRRASRINLFWSRCEIY